MSETISDICELIRTPRMSVFNSFPELADRIEAAHRRGCEAAEEGKYSVRSYVMVMHNQEALITELRKTIRKYRSYYKIRHTERLKLENARLRDALKPILAHDCTQYGHGRAQPEIVRIVREAQAKMKGGAQ